MLNARKIEYKTKVKHSRQAHAIARRYENEGNHREAAEIRHRGLQMLRDGREQPSLAELDMRQPVPQGKG